MFQNKVQRSYSAGLAGEILRDGPLRAKPGIIVSPTVGTDPAASTNRISRVFGWVQDMPADGVPPHTTVAALQNLVEVGGTVFYGLLAHPKHYALYGTTTGGPLAASNDLPQYSEGEFVDMGIIVAELFNETTALKDIKFGDTLAYAPKGISAGDNPQAIPVGGIISVPAGGTVPTGFEAIPNAKVVNTVLGVTASAAGAPISVLTVIQLTQ